MMTRFFLYLDSHPTPSTHPSQLPGYTGPIPLHSKLQQDHFHLRELALLFHKKILLAFHQPVLVCLYFLLLPPPTTSEAPERRWWVLLTVSPVPGSQRAPSIWGMNGPVWGSMHTAITRDCYRLQSDRSNAATGKGMEYPGQRDQWTFTSLTRKARRKGQYLQGYKRNPHANEHFYFIFTTRDKSLMTKYSKNIFSLLPLNQVLYPSTLIEKNIMWEGIQELTKLHFTSSFLSMSALEFTKNKKCFIVDSEAWIWVYIWRAEGKQDAKLPPKGSK